MDYGEWAKSYERTADLIAEMVHRNMQYIKHPDVSTSCKSLVAAKIHHDRALIRQCRKVAAELRKRGETHEIQ